MTIELDGKTLHRDDVGHWTMDEPEYGLIAEPIYAADAQDMIRKAGKRELFAQLFPLAHWDWIMRRTF